MTAQPYGAVLESTSGLPDDFSKIDAPTLPDSEEARIGAMCMAALREHWKAATGRVTPTGPITECDQQESIRVLCSRIEPWAATRRWLCEAAGLDPDLVRQAALKALKPREPRTKAAAVMRAGRIGTVDQPAAIELARR
jgi:hypothetical protein